MDPKEQLQNAYKEIRAGNFQKAEVIYRDILKISSNNFEANLNLGTIYARQSRFNEAVKYLEVAIAQNSQVPQIYNNLGLIYTHLDQNEKASFVLPLKGTGAKNGASVSTRTRSLGNSEAISRNSVDLGKVKIPEKLM